MRIRALAPLALALLSTPAAAVELKLTLDPGFAQTVRPPQDTFFHLGGGGQLNVGVQLLSFFDVEASAGFVALPATADAPSGDAGTSFQLGGGIRLHLPDKDAPVSPWVDGEAYYVRTGDKDRFGYSIGGGFQFMVGSRHAFSVGPYVRYLQIVEPSKPGFDTADAKIVLVGLSFGLNPQRLFVGDRDHDGIPDDVDKCPDEPEDKNGFEDDDGCPDANKDTDHDGVVDMSDKCPTVAGPRENGGCPDTDGDKDGVVDRLDACPSEPGPAATGGCPDQDGDGVADRDDKCPTVPGPKENHGCPVDTDGDGVTDDLDRCPKDPGPKELKGCPDRDKDGVADVDDRCPDKAGPVDNGGCPVYKLVKVTEGKIEISQKIFFAFDKATILPKSDALLGEVAQALKDHPALKVRIEGHTDAKGTARHNDKLSQARAESVRAWLVKHGIDAARLEAKGYGSSQPLDTNKTEAGREKNRRVEFVITSH